LSNQSDKILLSSFRKENRQLQASAIGKKIREKLVDLSIFREIIEPPTEKDLYFEG
jgi:hypothetical protein